MALILIGGNGWRGWRSWKWLEIIGWLLEDQEVVETGDITNTTIEGIS
jgi:hypothetical protein